MEENLNMKKGKTRKEVDASSQSKTSINAYTSPTSPIYSATVVVAPVDAGGAAVAAPVAARTNLLNSPQRPRMPPEPAVLWHRWFAQPTKLPSPALFEAVPVAYAAADTAVLGVALESWAVAAAVG